MNDKKVLEDSVNKIFNKVSETENLSFSQQLKQKYSFKAIHNKFLTTVMNLIVSWTLSCFNRYTENQFHTKMKGQFNYQDAFTGAVYPIKGFDFIGDWQVNHKQTFEKIIPMMKKLNVPINKNELLGLTLTAVRNHGWTVTEEESNVFRFTINRLYNILYHNVDSIQNLG